MAEHWYVLSEDGTPVTMNSSTTRESVRADIHRVSASTTQKCTRSLTTSQIHSITGCRDASSFRSNKVWTQRA
jgi:hypothetical protein